ncbi:MAG: hypothetical protein ACKVX7_15650 [Planctomycetota bacterium]
MAIRSLFVPIGATALAVALGTLTLPDHVEQEIQWRSDLKAAALIAAREGQPLLLVFR